MDSNTNCPTDEQRTLESALTDAVSKRTPIPPLDDKGKFIRTAQRQTRDVEHESGGVSPPPAPSDAKTESEA